MYRYKIEFLILMIMPQALGWTCVDENCYKYFGTPATWDRAFENCRKENGFLMGKLFTSNSENVKVSK